jgi:DNA-binding transcriptional MerR regulator
MERRREGRWRIADLVTLGGATPRAIRLYHKGRLLPEPERSESGYRRYGSADLASLIRVRRLRSLGFSLDQIRQLVSSSAPTDLPAALDELEDHLGRQVKQLQGAIRAIDEIRTEGLAERELYARLAPKVRAAIDARKDPDPEALDIAPLTTHLESLEGHAGWPLLRERLKLLRDSPLGASELEQLAGQLAAVLPAELLPDQLADPVIPTILLGGRFSRQQMEVLHRAGEIQRAKRRRRR